ncbi:MAG: protein-glutamate O-methyltransferase CheR [Ectobacillus sp.]
MNEHAYTSFITSFKARFGMDLSLYKQDRIRRRIESFLLRNGFTSYNSLLAALSDHKLLESFIEHLTINVSGFFRNHTRWEILEKKILPLLSQGNPRKLKVWSAACAAGEEPYTLSMILEKVFPNRYEIHATDIDSQILQKAKQGIYQDRSLTEVPEHIKNIHFIKEGQSYIVKPHIKQYVKFKKHDLLTHSYEQQYDLIVCRNVTIYFTEQARSMMYKKFSQSLRSGGVLFVGSTEQILAPEQYGLKVIDPFFYQKI